MPQQLIFLLSREWWLKAFSFVRAESSKFMLPVFLMALSNILALFANSNTIGGTNLNDAASLDLVKLLSMLLGALLALLVSLIACLLSCTLWLVRLTALTKQFLSNGESSFADCASELKTQKKYLSKVWLIGGLYMMAPVVPMSVLLALSILTNPQFTMLGQPLLSLPTVLVSAMNVFAALLFMVTTDYTIILLIFSAIGSLKPGAAASQSAKIFEKQLISMVFLNIFLFLLNGVISAPFGIVYAIPSLTPLTNNLAFSISCQLWFAATSLFTWPLSVIMFAEFLKPHFAKMEVNVT